MPAKLPSVFEDPRLFWGRALIGDGCWEWQGSRMGGAYGRVHVQRRGRYAHRVAWELTNGPIPDGLVVCHHCDNPPCVRPDHLFLGTVQDNTDDKMRKGRHVAHYGRWETCAAGHPRTPENVYVWRTQWKCRPCHADNERRRRAA